MATSVSSGLDIIYAAALVFGFGWALISFLLGELGSHGIEAEAHDIGADGHEGFHVEGGGHHPHGGAAHLHDVDGQISPLSPLILATGVGGFGGFGLLGSLVFQLGPLLSSLLALTGGILFGFGMYLLYARLLAGMQGSSEVRVEALSGVTGTVITPIPADSLGEISFVARGSRITSAARSATGQPIPRGRLVIIQEMQGPVAIVRETY